MKRIQYQNYGGPDEMKIEDFQLESPGKGEVVVQVKFAAINPIDWKMRSGQMKMITGKKFPRAMGMDLSGIVTAVGPDVKLLKVGDAVFGLARFKETGAIAQAVVTKEIFLSKKPGNISFEEAACLGTPGVTAWNALIDKAKLRTGQHVFINGCAGAVGEAALQIALMQGAIISGSCSAQDMQRAKALGIKDVYDYRKTDLTSIGNRFDVVFDTAVTMSLATGKTMLKKRGVFLDLDPTPGKFIRAIFDRKLKLVICTPHVDTLSTLGKAASEGRFKIKIGEIVPLSSAAALICKQETGTKLGGKGVVAME